MAEARRTEVEGVGYVVIWFEDHKSTPLRAFFSPGAALEFRDMVNGYNKPDKERRIKALATSYTPTVVYDYPERSQIGIARLKPIKI